ncbi:hypothetical protein [uncultured Desulfobacter sp.]|uniref:hypothetical protein n=1 Tax=uncultured Desulfobacter sp. TaxID=240139 RepID=UPI002AABE2B7|nr:hypothetical protein [uncultured Desulfobacter sp.]
MVFTTIDTTEKYRFERLVADGSDETDIFRTEEGLRTFYLHRGKIELIIQNQDTTDVHSINEGEGAVLLPGTTWKINAISGFDSFHVVSHEIFEPPVEIIDDGYGKKEIPLESSKILKNIKKVKKPWGHELWIIWTKKHHVLKQIYMVAGKQSSLQLHKAKLETNFLVEGKADVIAGLHVDLNDPAYGGNIPMDNLDAFRTSIQPGEFWTCIPGEVHRVISMSDYLAYEVSTPELDDVIRLADDSGRLSGRIDTEHRE